MSTINLGKVDARNRLAPRRDPYWQRLEVGSFLGFRKMASEANGTWLVRYRDDANQKQIQKPLGEFNEHPAHARFDIASKVARDWLAHLGRGGKAETITVRVACQRYVEHLRAAGKQQAALDTEQRFARWVNDHKIGRITLQKLKPSDVEAWRLAMARTLVMPQDKKTSPTRPRAPSTVNRDMTSLRAAFNLALENGETTSDMAWKTKLRPIKDADGRRDVYLDADQRRALISKAGADLAAFLGALSLLPMRPGAIASLAVRHFDIRLSTLTIGKDKQGRDRKITLPPATSAFFAEQCKDKLANAPLLSRADGSAWNKDAWKGPVKTAVIAADLPANATAYALRHSTITDLIALHRLDTLTVAQLSGTSLAMIEKHYGHLLRDHAAKALASLTL